MKNAPALPFSALCAALLCASCGNDRGAPAAESAEVVEAPAATAETTPAAADNASPPALADAIADGIRSRDVEVTVADLAVNDRSAIMTEVANSGIVAFGAPTMNNRMYPAMADVLCYVRGLRPQNKIGFAFGSFGWSGEGAKQIAAELEAMNMEQVVEPLQVKYMPTQEELDKARAAGVALADALLAKINK